MPADFSNLGDLSSTNNVSEQDAVDKLFGEVDDEKSSKSDGDDEDSDSSDSSESSESDSSEEEDADESESDEGDASDDEESDDEKSASGQVDYSPVNAAALQKKYPELYKDFPALKSTIEREQRFTEIFPTTEEAEQAQDIVQEYQEFGGEILRGNAKHFLTEVKKLNPKSYETFAGNFLDAVRDSDSKLFNNILSPVIQNVVKHVFATGVSSGNKNLELAAAHISNFLFNTPDPEQLKTEKPDKEEKDPERERFEEERRQFEVRKFESTVSEVGNSCDKVLAKEVEASIDPNDKMTPYTRTKAVQDVLNKVAEKLNTNIRHKSVMSNLWKKAARAGYPEAMRKEIRNAFLASARQMLPQARLEVRQEIFKNGSSKTEKKKGKVIPAGRVPSGSTTKSVKHTDPKMIDWSKTSERDILEGKITLKK